jgi:uncharacterized protein YukE
MLAVCCDIIELCERLPGTIDTMARTDQLANRPRTEMHRAWDGDQPEQFQSELQMWKNIMEKAPH